MGMVTCMAASTQWQMATCMAATCMVATCMAELLHLPLVATCMVQQHQHQYPHLVTYLLTTEDFRCDMTSLANDATVHKAVGNLELSRILFDAAHRRLISCRVLYSFCM